MIAEARFPELARTIWRSGHEQALRFSIFFAWRKRRIA
jgi:hypothetical protein